MTAFAPAAGGHLARLADALADLRHRVRMAVAAEAAAAVADAVRRVLTAALAPSDRADRPEPGRPARDGWDDTDGWGDDGNDGGDGDFGDDEPDPARPAPLPPREPARRPWVPSVWAGVAVTRWLLARPASAWLAVAAGALAAAAALTGGVAGRIGLAAADLLDLARPPAGP